MGRAKRIWYLSPMRAAKVQASLRIRAVSPEPPLLAHTSSESRGIFRQKAQSQAPLNGWACAVEICHDGMLEDTNSLDGAQMRNKTTLKQLTYPASAASTNFSTLLKYIPIADCLQKYDPMCPNIVPPSNRDSPPLLGLIYDRCVLARADQRALWSITIVLGLEVYTYQSPKKFCIGMKEK